MFCKCDVRVKLRAFLVLLWARCPERPLVPWPLRWVAGISSSAWRTEGS